jgi:ubiquinone/menaquinone biosynthesis C-methylase UbiE
MPMDGQLQHAMLPKPNQDELSRQLFVTGLRRHLTGSLTPGNQAVYHARTKQAFVDAHGREPRNRGEVRSVMLGDPYYQFWSALQRASQQMIWDSVTDTIERDHEALAEAAELLTTARAAGGMLSLNPNLAVPEYVTAADIHLMPGGYGGVGQDREMRQGPLYDRGLYLYIGGQCGPENDGLSHLLWGRLRQDFPDLKPRRILDMGCTIGNSSVPWKRIFPDAEVIGIDVSATALRYAHARAEALGVPVRFVQSNAELTEFEPASFDLIVSCLLLHETSAAALPRIFAECKRLLSPGGVMAHLDVPQVIGLEPLQAFLTSWEEENNNENFAHLIREYDLPALARSAGFPADSVRQPNIPMIDGIDIRNYDASRMLAWTYLTAQS